MPAALSSLQSFVRVCSKSVDYFDMVSVSLCWKAVSLRHQIYNCTSIALSWALRLPEEGCPEGKLTFSREFQIKQSFISHAFFFKL